MMTKTLSLPAKKPVPAPDVPMQAWDSIDFENSAYNNALDDVEQLLIAQGFEITQWRDAKK